MDTESLTVTVATKNAVIAISHLLKVEFAARTASIAFLADKPVTL